METHTLSEWFYRVNALNQEQRDAAYEGARKRIAGAPPERNAPPELAHFQRTAQGKYPPSVTRTITALCALMLAAAFVPSAMRLHLVGAEGFALVFDHATTVYVAALCIVLMAETGQVIFSLAAATNAETRTQRWGLGAGALICTAIAITGNAVAVGNHAFDHAFAFLETFAPPILVLITSQILKTQMLHAVEARQHAQTQYAHAYATWQTQTESAERLWQAAYDDATQHTAWDRTLANNLKDALRSANKQSKAVLRELTAADWFALVLRERNAEEWYDAEAQRVQQATARLATASVGDGAPSERRATGERIAPTGAGDVTLGASDLRFEGNEWVRTCPVCGEEFRATERRVASARYSAHSKRHVNDERKAQGGNA